MSEKTEAGPQSDNEYILKFEPKFMDSLDARILQYKYALVKLERLIKAIDEFLVEAGSSANNVVLMHYIIYLSSNLFAINESGFFSKLEALENFKVLKSTPIATSQVVTHIPYDMRDQAIVPLDDLPTTNSSIACLKAFRVLCLTCQDAYQKRFTNASNEIANDKYLEDLDFLFKKVFFTPEKDFDMVLTSSLFKSTSLIFQLDTQMSVLGDYSEASLIDIDICSLFTIVLETTKMISSQKSTIIKYKIIKQAPKNVQEGQLKEIPHNTYALHRVFFWALRINELYFMLRKYGRQIFISNHDHLHDQKFFSFVSNGSHYKDMLREIDENFFNAKKNGVLIATITRFLRMDSKHEISSKTVFDFVGFIHQSMLYIEGLLAVLKEFGYAWLSAEIAFRTSHDLPVDHLLKVNDIVEGEKVKDLKAKRLRAQLLAKQKAKQNPVPTAKPQLSRPTNVTKPAAPRSPLGTPTDPKRPSTPTEQIGRSRTNSLINKPPDIRSPFYLQRQSSTSSLQSTVSASSTMEKKPNDPPAAEGRRRSSSQPISFNAAATALKSNTLSTPSKLDGYVRSPSGSIKRVNLITKKPPSAAASPLNNKRPVMDVVEEKKEASPPNTEVRRTASQKFQQHLLEASRSGALYSKEKEVFSNVVFDPNNPSATNLRRQTKPAVPAPQDISPSRGDISPPKVKMLPANVDDSPSKMSTTPLQIATSDQKPTRAQITRLNTRRNSVVVQPDNQSHISDLSRNSTISSLSQTSPVAESIVIKKVRFTGVPEYTPAEDAPSSQTSRILKGFAALKIPAVKRKDEAFKQEESHLFKQYLHQGEPAVQSNAGIYAPGNQITLKFSRFKNRF